jgi:hypothetical protein
MLPLTLHGFHCSLLLDCHQNLAIAFGKNFALEPYNGLRLSFHSDSIFLLTYIWYRKSIQIINWRGISLNFIGSHQISIHIERSKN